MDQCSLHFLYTAVYHLFATSLLSITFLQFVMFVWFSSRSRSELFLHGCGAAPHFTVYWLHCLIPECIHSLTSAAVRHIRPWPWDLCHKQCRNAIEYASTVFWQLSLIPHKGSAASVTGYNLHTWKCSQQTVHSCLVMYVRMYLQASGSLACTPN